MPTLTAPICACGERMVEMAVAGFFECSHCDGACHVRCDEKCAKSRPGDCARCIALDIGTRPKKDRRWMPPKRA